MNIDFPKGRSEFKSAWSIAAGEASALSGVLAILEKRMGTAYVAGRDDAARELRDAAHEVRSRQRDAQQTLQAYIEEDLRQDYCKQKGIKV